MERKNYRGGKPYGAEHILPYVTDLYIRRKDQIDTIVDSAEPKEAFMGLCKEMIAVDTARLTKQNQQSTAKRAASHALALTGAIIATKWVNQVTYMQEMKHVAMAIPQVEAH